MFEKVASYCKEHDLLRAGDRVVAGVSGGADSVCLLHVLVRLRRKLGLTVRAVHVHHGLRGEEADRDAAFVEWLTAEWKVPCRVVYADVREYAEENRLSDEEAGRLLRYRALAEEAGRMSPFARVAVGHQKEDQAETILHNLFRGSALKGLAGMEPSVMIGEGGVCLIRPLLGVSREEIRTYLAENGLNCCEDSTNSTADYTRNRIRQMLPQICRDVNERAVDHILAAGERMAQADAYFEKEAERIWEESGVTALGQDGRSEKAAAKRGDRSEKAAARRGDRFEKAAARRGDRSGKAAAGPAGRPAEIPPSRCGIPAEVLNGQPKILAGYLAMKMIKRMTGSLKDITSVHADQILALARMETGKQASLPYGLRAVHEYDMVWLERTEPGAAAGSGPAAAEPAEAITFSRFPYEKNQKIPENRYTKWFDYDKIEGVLSVRTRQTGDYITLKDGHRKSVKSYMIDEKIPRPERDRILLLAEGSHVLWIVGYRISEYYKVTEITKEILQARARGGEEDVADDTAAFSAGQRGRRQAGEAADNCADGGLRMPAYGGEEHGREDTGIDSGRGCE